MLLSFDTWEDKDISLSRYITSWSFKSGSFWNKGSVKLHAINFKIWTKLMSDFVASTTLSTLHLKTWPLVEQLWVIAILGSMPNILAVSWVNADFS